MTSTSDNSTIDVRALPSRESSVMLATTASDTVVNVIRGRVGTWNPVGDSSRTVTRRWRNLVEGDHCRWQVLHQLPGCAFASFDGRRSAHATQVVVACAGHGAEKREPAQLRQATPRQTRALKAVKAFEAAYGARVPMAIAEITDDVAEQVGGGDAQCLLIGLGLECSRELPGFLLSSFGASSIYAKRSTKRDDAIWPPWGRSFLR